MALKRFFFISSGPTHNKEGSQSDYQLHILLLPCIQLQPDLVLYFRLSNHFPPRAANCYASMARLGWANKSWGSLRGAIWSIICEISILLSLFIDIAVATLDSNENSVWQRAERGFNCWSREGKKRSRKKICTMKKICFIWTLIKAGLSSIDFTAVILMMICLSLARIS